MPSSDTSPQLTEEDITEFGRQLYEWTKSLPLVQRGLLHRLLARAAAAQDGDTAGYATLTDETLPFAAFARLLGRALGAAPDGAARP